MSLKQISVFLENKPGMMYHVSEILAKHKVDMRALSLAETSDFGIVRIIVDDVYKAATVLKDEGCIHSITPVIGVAIPDEPGGLHQVLSILQAAGLNIEYMYAFLGGKTADHAYMIFRVQDDKAAVKALGTHGIRCVDQEEISEL